ncbi:hypothetical protein LTS18_004021, partial [Coniosporium uncinatum]
MPSHSAHHPPHARGSGEAGNEHSTVGGAAGHESGGSNDMVVPQDEQPEKDREGAMEHGCHNHSHNGSERPMFATVTVAVCHCGAGCVIGDVIGEWLVYGTNATINDRTLWPEFLI